jgi:hypothetical protein
VFGNEIGMLPEAVACAFDLDDDGVVEQPVQQRRGDDRIAEHLAPFGEAAVGCQDHGTLLAAGVDELEEAVAVARRDRQIADLVDDEQVRALQLADALFEFSLPLGLGERGHDVG